MARTWFETIHPVLACCCVVGLYLRGLLHQISLLTGSPTPLHLAYDLDTYRSLYCLVSTALWIGTYPLWLTLSLFPSASQLSWVLVGHYLLATPLTVWLMEGAWWTYS